MPGTSLGIERCATRRARTSRELRRAAARSARVCKTARAARHHQVDVALHRAPTRLPRLHRGQALRRRRRRLRRASLSRPVHAHRLQRQSGRHPAAAPQDRQRDPPREPAARRPRREAARSTFSTTIRATSSSRFREDELLAHGDRHPASWRPAAFSPVRAPRSVRAVRHVPDLRAARALHDGSAAEMAGDPDGGVQRPELRLQRPPVGIAAGARDDHRAHDARPHAASRRPRARGAARRGSAPLGSTISRTR